METEQNNQKPAPYIVSIDHLFWSFLREFKSEEDVAEVLQGDQVAENVMKMTETTENSKELA